MSVTQDATPIEWHRNVL